MHLSRGDLGDLNLFCAIAKTGGFRKTAAELDFSPSALSHAIRGLEKRLGVRLFNRTNRSVTLTPAGRELLSHVTSGLSEITNGLEALNRFRDRPAGQLRLNVPTDAARLVLAPVMARYAALYPDVRLEVAVEDAVVDIIEQGFDAGVRYGGTIPEDMIAVPLCPDLRWVPDGKSQPLWFARSDGEPLAFFAGIWCRWMSVRKLADGETTDDLFGVSDHRGPPGSGRDPSEGHASDPDAARRTGCVDECACHRGFAASEAFIGWHACLCRSPVAFGVTVMWG